MKQNKILLINDTLTNHGGAETYCFLLKELLDEHGYKTHLIGAETGVGLADSFLSRWYNFKYYKMVKDAIEAFSPDIIHAHNISRVVSPSVLTAGATAGIPIVQTVHDYHYICPKLWMITDKDTIITEHNSFFDCLLHHLPKKGLVYATTQSLKATFHKSFIKKYVNHFICPSRNLARWYAKIFDPSHVSYLPLFVEKEKKYLRQPTENMLLFVGRLSKEKGIDILLKAFALALQDIPGLRLLIIGDGPQKQTLQSLTHKLTITTRVQFLNQISHEKIATYYQQAAALIIPSSWMENCPMVALEAIAAGCPIIASHSGGLTDLVKDATTGYLFERNNIQILAEKICMLSRDKTLQKEFSENQRQVAHTLNKENHFKELKQIYNIYL